MADTRDNVVGTPEGKPIDPHRQSRQQADITRMEPEKGLSDSERADMGGAGEPGRAPVTLGGSSNGHSDRVSGRSGQPDADGDAAYLSERAQGRGRPEMDEALARGTAVQGEQDGDPS